MTAAYDLDGRRFSVVANDQGIAGLETCFHYRQDGDLITGDYRGGHILAGNFVGRFVAPDRIELRFQCLDRDQQLRSGLSLGRISKADAGRLCLEFDWAWLDGDREGGHSRHIEMR